MTAGGVNSVMTSLVKLCSILMVLAPQLVLAHASIEQRILSATTQLAADPNNIELYLLRGDLYVSHNQWRAAEADFNTVAQIDESESRVHLYLGRLYLAEYRFTQAARELNNYLAYSPKDSSARVTLAQVLLELERPLDAVEQYNLAIESHAKPSPDWYLARAQALAATAPLQLEEALLGLDQGIEQYGPLATLQLYAISLEVRRKDYDTALLRLDSLAQQSSRKENWLQRRAEILHKAGRDAQALEISDAAHTALLSLSANKRETQAMRELEAKILAFQKCVKTLGSLCST